MLAKWSGQTDIPVGVIVANRTRPEIAKLIGCFVNVVVVRATVAPDLTFRALLGRTRDLCLEAYNYQYIPFEKVVEEINPERDPDRNPLFQIAFNMKNYSRTVLQMGTLKVERTSIDRQARSTFDLKIDADLQDGVSLDVTYNPLLFSESTIVELFEYFKLLLACIAKDPSASIQTYSVLSSHKVTPIPSLTIQESVDGPNIPLDPFCQSATLRPPRTDVNEFASPENSKVDGQYLKSTLPLTYQAPLTLGQKALCALFQEVLGIDRIGINDNFFDLGGHSLLVLLLTNRIRAHFNVNLPVRVVFDAPTVAQLSDKICHQK